MIRYMPSFFDELEKIAAGFQGKFLQSPAAKQLVQERMNWRAMKPRSTALTIRSAALAARPTGLGAARQTPEQAMMAKLRAGMQKPSGAKQAMDAERVAAAGRGYGRAITSVE